MNHHSVCNINLAEFANIGVFLTYALVDVSLVDVCLLFLGKFSKQPVTESTYKNEFFAMHYMLMRLVDGS